MEECIFINNQELLRENNGGGADKTDINIHLVWKIDLVDFVESLGSCVIHTSGLGIGPNWSYRLKYIRK